MAQLLQRRFGNALGLDAKLLGALLQKVARQHENIFAALAQRGQAQANHIQAVKQILAKAPFLDALLQILVRRSNHAHIGLDGAVAADTVKMAVAQHPQQARLQIKRHVADFIEKQRASVGLLEAPAPQRLRAGEGTALVTEQLAFQQVFRNRCRVDGDERPVGARRVLVQRARYQLLARTRLAGDHHRHHALAQAANGAEHVLHRGRLAEHFGRFGHALFGDFLALALFDGAADQFNSLEQVKRLG